MYVPAAKHKWHRQDISERLQFCNKSVWLIGPILRDHWQHAWLVGSNWPKDPGYLKLGFVRWDSAEGQQRWQTITTTYAQRRQTAA